VVVLLYLKLAWRQRRDEGRLASFEDLPLAGAAPREVGNLPGDVGDFSD
jgi:hypothetical protein